MEKKMPYSLYKRSYADFSAHGYDPRRKEITVTMPDYRRPNFPASWSRSGNYIMAGNGVRIIAWNTGFAENFVVEHGNGSRSFPAGLYARQNVIDYVMGIQKEVK